MNRRSFCLLLAAAMCGCASARAEGGLVELYPFSRLAQEKSRFERRVGHLYHIIANLIVQNGASDAERRILQQVQLEFPMADENGSPINFYSRGGRVVAPVLSLLFLEDLCTAYAWLDRHGYSLETIDEYLAMLQYKPADEFPGHRYPPPLEALGVSPSAADEPEAGQLGLRLRNSAYAFILAHELGHVLRGHPSYDKVTMQEARRNEAEADDFALNVLATASEIPMGAVLYFQSAAYTLPNRGLFVAQGKNEADWEDAMHTWITHPLTSDRLEAIGLKLNDEAARLKTSAERSTMSFIAVRIGKIAEILSDQDLQQCMAVAARRADVSVLAPQTPGPSDRFLGKCVGTMDTEGPKSRSIRRR
jgi:hypothetical protein